MRKLILILISACFAVFAPSQTVTEDYYNKIPALPRESCNITRENIESFTRQVSSLIEEVDDRISEMNRQENESAKKNEAAARETAMKQMQQQYGLSQEEMEMMKDGKNLSAAEKQAMVNKMMMQQTNMSMDEIDKVSKMSEAGKKAYAEAYIVETMATGQVDQKNKAAVDKSKSTQELLSEQRSVMNKISEGTLKIGNLYTAIETDPEGEQMINKIEAWRRKWISMMGVDYGQGKQMDSLMLLIKNEQIKYCDKFSPRYRAVLNEHQSIIKTSLPDYQRLADITSAITEAYTGIPSSSQGNDISGMSAIKEYLSRLLAAYKFKLYYPEDN